MVPKIWAAHSGLKGRAQGGSAARLMSTLPPFAAIVVAAGQGLQRGTAGLPKQFAMWRGKPVVRHSVEALLAAGASPLVVAIPAGRGRHG